jgi:diguanylate cyclase (GGDEF)-like protein/PAS domain S-box-containing protein
MNMSEVDSVRDNLEAYSILVKHSLQASLIFQKGQLVFANKAANLLFKYDPKNDSVLSIQQIFTRIRVEDQELFWQAIRESEEEASRPIKVELQLNHLGSSKWLEADACQIEYMDQPASLVEFVDITDRKKAEINLIQYEEKNRALFDSIPLGIYRTTPDGQILEINQTGVEMLGYKNREAVLKINTLQFYVNPEDRSRWQAAIERDGVLRNFETQMKRPDGSIFWVVNNAHAVKSDGDRILYYEGTLEDINERKRVEIEGQQTAAQLATWVDQLKQRNRESTLLNAMGELLQSCLTIGEMNKVVAQSAAEIFLGQAGAFYIYKKAVNLLEVVATWGPGIESEAIFPPDACWGLRRGRPHIAAGSQVKLRCRHSFHRDSTRFFSPYMCVPMTAQGETLGLLYLEASEDKIVETWSPLATVFAERVALALANLRLRETLRMQAIRDPLTGLFNRRYMEETLERELRRAIRHKRPVGVIMIDADHFRTINNSVGHSAGDAMMQALGQFFQNQIRAEDIPCRYGGDEFVLILPDSSLDDTYRRAEELRQGVKLLHVQHAGRLLSMITISLGVACSPDNGISAEEVLLAADRAMFFAKEEGRDKVEVAEK